MSDSKSSRPPSGTVTFLFTDIEGSTRLWEEHRHEMAAAVAEHDRILAEVVETGGGFGFSSAGDSHAAAFSRAGQAVQAAINGQLALQKVMVEGGPLSVRMAIHVGEAEERDGDYFGPALNRAARLRDAAHGGQILLSRAVEELIGEALPDQVGLLDLGEHGLRDLTRPERIYQVTHPDLPATFPPVQTLEVPRHNLPIALTSFVGREQELAEVQKLLQGSRLVTLTGAGGCGKTRLAVQAAASMLDEFPDGVWFVALAPVADPELVVGTTVRSMELQEPGDGTALEVLLTFVRPRKALVVLDNCEHLLGAASQLTATMLRAAPRLRVLATTREPLRLQGETVWPIQPLRIPAEDTPDGDLLRFESVRLFQERAESARPGFRILDANGGAVRQICRRLDGIPLALELVTARLRVLSTEEIATRLENSFSVLGSAGTDVPPHHRTLEATLDWSFDLLTQREQTLLVRLSVFVGGWTMEAAEQVCGGDDIDSSAVLRLIFALADKSLVMVGEDGRGTRYRLLEPIRQYTTRMMAETGVVDIIRRRHAEHFSQLAQESFRRIVGPEEVKWLDRLESEVDNLRAALAWCLEVGETQMGQLMAGALYRFWGRSLRDVEARNWLQRMLDADATPGTPRARALLGLGTVLDWSVVEGASLLDEALALYRSFGPDYELEIALNNRGAWALVLGDSQQAADLWGEALDSARHRGDDAAIAQVLMNLSEIKAKWEGDLDAAAVLADGALAVARRFGSAQVVYVALACLAAVKADQGDFPAAISALEEALEIERRPGARIWHEGRALIDLAEVAYRAAKFDQALEYLSQHQEQVQAHRHEAEEGLLRSGHSLHLRGMIQVARGHHRRGVALLAFVATSNKDEVPSPNDQEQFDAAVAHARQALDEQEFNRAWNEGSAMTLSQAVDYALEQAAK